MFFRILKKDFKRKRAMNAILLLFVILAAMFLSSSTANLLIVTGAVDSYMEKADTPDYLIVTNQEENREEAQVDTYLKKNHLVRDYDILRGIVVSNANFEVIFRQTGEDGGKKYETTSTAALFPEHQGYLKVFDEDGNDLDLKPGEIAVGTVEAEKNHLQRGDILKLMIGDVEKEFTVAHITKDVAFGSTMMGFRRFVLCREDFAEYDKMEGIPRVALYNVMTEETQQFQKDIQAQDFPIFSSVDKELIKTCYLMDMLVSGILIIVSICLILIAFLILRFTIVFTIQEDYREIGVMKAIGIRDSGIKGVYMVKYTVIAAFGAVLGWILGFPFSELLLRYAISNILIDHAENYGILRAASAAAVIFLVTLFCYTSTGKLKKVSVIEAIREGGTGERFSGKNLMHLKNSRFLSTPVFLACNDISGNIRRFLVLAATFCLGTLLILIPLSAIQTLKSDSIVRLFGVAPSDAYLRTENMENYLGSGGEELLDKDMDHIEKIMAEAGAPVKVRAEMGNYIKYYKEDSREVSRIYTLQSYRYGGIDYDFLEGSYPVNPDEVALTEMCADKLGVRVGDTLRVAMDGIDRKVILTGVFQSMNMMGEVARVGEEFDIPFSNAAGMYALQVDYLGTQTTEEYETLLETKFPNYEWKDDRQFINSMVGDTLEQMDVFKSLITGVVLLINALITILMMKTLMTKERQEIAVMKSIGYKNSVIRKWQTIRILIVLTVSIVLAVLFTKVLSPLTMGQIFDMMGATSIHMKCNPVETYVVYPLLLLGVTGTVAYLASGAVKRIDAKEMNC